MRLLHRHRSALTISALLLALLPCVTFAAGLQDGPVSSPPLEEVRLQLKWSHQFQFAGYYAAIAKGYYREAGFSVSLIEGRSTRSVREIVLSGEAEYGVAGSELVLGYMEGEPLAVLAAIFQHSSYALLALRSSGIRTPEQLAGRRIILRNGVPSTEIYAMLEQAGVGRDRFTEIPHTFRHEDLLEGKADAMSVYLTDQPFFEGVAGGEYVLLRPIAFGVDFYGDCLFTTQTALNEHRDRTEAFRAASLKGWRYAMEHPGEIIAWIQQNYPGRRTDAQLRNEADQMQSLILPDLVPMGQMNPERWERIASAYRDTGMTASHAELRDFQFHEDTGFDAVLLRRLLWVCVPLAFVVASWIAFLIHFNRRLATAVHERTLALQCVNEDLQEEAQRRGEAERLIRESMDALARHQEQLESLVRERTAALEQAQADLLRKERLATLGQLIGTVSHEIRNPLGTIRGSVFSIDQMLKKQDFSRIGPVLERAERNIIRCDRIIEELLDFTRARKLDRQSTHLDAWLQDVLEDIPLTEGILCDLDLTADSMVLVDREQLRRAIVNLINNAAQAMETGPGYTLGVSTVRDNGEVEIRIRDQGAGIPSEHMEKIFEPLFSTRGFGVGLGVPIIKDIIDAHGGRLRYESAVGEGTTVRIWLPVA